MDCITRGESYDEMADSYVIFICGFDPFGQGRVRYTAAMSFREGGGELADGAVRVFVNARAHAKCADERLARVLEYLCDGTIGDEFTSELDKAVRRVRDRPEWRRKRMRLDVMLRDEFVEGRKEGLAEGREEGRAEGRAEGRDEGRAEVRGEIARLAEAMQAAGRTEELPSALADPGVLESLLREFGIA